jgi:hypothetical protein
MSALRKLATRLLRAVLRHSSAERCEWASAMLRELDFIQSDWEALFWALGSAAAILRHSGCGVRTWVENRRRKREGQMNPTGKKAIGVASGIGLALALALVVVGLRVLSFQYFPNLEAGRVPWRLLLFVMVIPETILVVATVALWRKRRPMATGILITALAIGVHFAIHIAHLWHG